MQTTTELDGSPERGARDKAGVRRATLMAEARRLRNLRQPWKAIAKALGVSMVTARRYGYNAKDRERIRRERQSAVEDMRMKGMTFAEIGKQLGISKQAAQWTANNGRPDARR